jgi:hypothetical protein
VLAVADRQKERTLANIRLSSSFINGHDRAAYGGVVGGRMWMPHHELVREMKTAFEIRG